MATSTVNSIDWPAEFDSPMHTIFLFSFWACGSVPKGSLREWLERPAVRREGQWFRGESEAGCSFRFDCRLGL
jgi:hypothetical protein